MNGENKKGREVRPLGFLAARNQTERGYFPTFLQSMSRDELHDFMMEVFLRGYLRSDGNFRPLSLQEVLSLYRYKINEIQNRHSLEKSSNMSRSLWRCIVDSSRRFGCNRRRWPLLSAAMLPCINQRYRLSWQSLERLFYFCWHFTRYNSPVI